MSHQFEYHVFLSHNSADKQAVTAIAERLRGEFGLKCFLDAWDLIPGGNWQAALESALECSETAAVFFGPGGRGPWHGLELRVLTDRAARERNEFRLIPVLLPGGDPNQIGPLLRQFTWVNMRSGLDDPQQFARLVSGIKGIAPEAAAGDEITADVAPYRGLERFDGEHAEFFFGRDGDIRRLCGAVQKLPFVAVIGASGSGKSSLVRAGLETKVAKSMLPWLGHATILTVLPGSDPIRALAEQVAAAVLPNARRDERPGRADEYARRLQEEADGLRTLLRSLFPHDDDFVLLVIDQFEEIFTHSREQPGGSNAVRQHTAMESFLAVLSDLATGVERRFRLVITLRADFLARCLECGSIRALLENELNPQLLLGELSHASLREVIVLPAQHAGAYFEKGLVERILQDVEDQRGSLPLLQSALKELWRDRRGRWLTNEAYTDKGGVAGAMKYRADETLRHLESQGLEPLARNVLLRLTTPGEGVPDTRRRVPQNQLYPYGIERPLVERVLQELGGHEARLVVMNDDGTVEVTHDALIQRWDKLQTWLKETRDALRIRERLRSLVDLWMAQSKRPKYLCPLGQLEEAEDLLKSKRVAFDDDEVEYLRVSRRHHAVRRRTLVGLATAASILATMAGVFAWRAELASREATRQATKAENRRREAVNERVATELQRQHATHARNEAEKLIEFMLFDLRDSLEPIGRLDLLDDVNRRAREYYEAFVEAGDSPEAIHRRRAAMFHYGTILNDQGDLAGALKAFQTAVAISQRALEQKPSEPEARHDFAISLSAVGHVFIAQGNLADGLKAHRDAHAIFRALTDLDSENVDWQAYLALSYQNLGGALVTQGDLSEGLSNSLQSLAIYQKLASSEPNNSRWHGAAAGAFERIGAMRKMQGDLTSALQSYKDSLGIRELLATDSPADMHRQHELATCQIWLGEVLRAQGDLGAALDRTRAAQTVLRKLNQHDPSNAGWQQDLAACYGTEGELLRERFELAEAAEAFRASLAIQQKLRDQDTTNLDWQYGLAECFRSLGDTLFAQRNYFEALKSYQSYIGNCLELAERDPNNAEFQKAKAIAYAKAGDVYKDGFNDAASAIALYRGSLKTFDQLAQQDQTDATVQQNSAVTHEKVGDLLAANKDITGALEAYHSGLVIRERLANQDPSNVVWQRDLAGLNDKTVNMLMAQRDAPRGLALQTFRASLRIHKNLAAKDPANPQWQYLLAVSHERIGTALMAEDEFADALTEYQSSRGIIQEFATREPGNANWQRGLAACHSLIGDALKARGDLPDAVQTYRDALAIREQLASQEPDRADLQAELAGSLSKLGTTLAISADAKPQARTLLERGRDILVNLRQSTGSTIELEQELEKIERALRD